jgi:hypothetical protein
MFPTFKIKTVIENETGNELIGTLSSDSYKGEKWVDDKWLGFIVEDNRFIYGRWHKLEDNWKFVIKPEEIFEANFYEGQELSAVEGYWGERIELIIDKNTIWKQTVYKAANNDDHDHCFFCWATINEYENNKYMLANERIAVCLNCYENYVVKESFDFIVVPKK